MAISRSFARVFLMCNVFLLPTLAAGKGIPVASFVNPQNQVRAKHGLPPLRWSAEVANFAEWYANQRRRDCKLIHSSGDFGENLFWGRGKRWTPADAVAAWAAEEPLYDYKTNRCLPNTDCLHYTQLVWRATTMVGCAKMICDSGDTFIICNYYPHGNIIGARPY